MNNQRKIKSIYISWTNFNWHAHLFSETLNAKIYFIRKTIFAKIAPFILNNVIDYAIKSIKTIFYILNNSNNHFFFENPPPIASVIGFLFKKINKNFKYVIDAHNGAFEPPMINFPFVIKAFNNADAVIVHNNPLRIFLQSKNEFNNCTFFTLNDPIPKIPDYSIPENKDKYFLVVTTFHGDEPIEIVLEGIELFLSKTTDSKVEFHVSGNYNKKINVYKRFKKIEGIKFLGFVDQETYHRKLTNSIGVMSYSVREMVQQFALMESLGANKAFISNKNLTNIELFDKKMILTEINPELIAAGIEEFLLRKDELGKNIVYLREHLTEIRINDFNNLISYLKTQKNIYV